MLLKDCIDYINFWAWLAFLLPERLPEPGAAGRKGASFIHVLEILRPARPWCKNYLLFIVLFSAPFNVVLQTLNPIILKRSIFYWSRRPLLPGQLWRSWAECSPPVQSRTEVACRISHCLIVSPRHEIGYAGVSEVNADQCRGGSLH